MFEKKFLINVLDEKNKDFYQTHTTFHEGDSGLDLFCVDDILIPSGETKMVKLGIKCQSRKLSLCVWKWMKGSFYNYYSYFLFPRSSISKTPLILKNSIGLIDAGYTGELMAAMYNTSSDPFLIKRGDRYVQLVNPNLEGVSFELVEDVRTTTRGSGGFGSTGVSQTRDDNLYNKTFSLSGSLKPRELPVIKETNNEIVNNIENGPIDITSMEEFDGSY